MKSKYILCASTALLCMPDVALAQPAAVPLSTSVAAADGDDMVLPEIVVTAEKRSVSLQKSPLAISAYTAEARQLLGLNTLQDVTNFTPGLTYSAGTDRVFIRGVGRQTNTNGSDPGVAT